MNFAIIDQLPLNLENIFFNNTPQISCKSLLCFAKIRKTDYSKIAFMSLEGLLSPLAPSIIPHSHQNLSCLKSGVDYS